MGNCFSSTASTDGACCTVEFQLLVVDYAPSYCNVVFSRGSRYPNCVYMFYLFGPTASGDGFLPGSLAVMGFVEGKSESVQLSPKSQPLLRGHRHYIKWTYDNVNGGMLYVDEQPVGPAVPYQGPLDENRAPPSEIVTGRVIYDSGNAFYHSVLHGEVSGIRCSAAV